VALKNASPFALLVGVALLTSMKGAVAQPAPQPTTPAPAPSPAPTPTIDPAAPVEKPAFDPPKAVGSTDVPYPVGAPSHDAPVVVTVKLLVNKDGAVEKVDLTTPAQPPFDDAVIASAKLFIFQPATYGGKPVPVEITFSHTFLPPPPEAPPPLDNGPPRTAILKGKLVELGTRARVGSASITVIVDNRKYVAEGDREGTFEIAVPPGPAKVIVSATNHNPFLQQETLVAKQALSVSYYIERDRYDPYEIIVLGEQRREEVSRITLRGPELTQIPGTFGDPFRVVQALPGVGSTVSLLPFPIVRGTSPSSTGFLLDGNRIPLLYHLFSGPSVIHPAFIDEIQFYPGGAPVPYGGYTGGIIDGRTKRAGKDEKLLDVDINLLQVGALVRRPIPKVGTLTVAGRYGFPGLVLSLATKRVSLSYWDYQFRLDGGNAKTGWTVAAFGANDQLDTPVETADSNDPSPELEPTLILGFHRGEARYHRTMGDLLLTSSIVVGRDRTITAGTNFGIFSGELASQLRWKPNDKVSVVGGIEGSLRLISNKGDVDMTEPTSMLTSQVKHPRSVAGFVETLWRPTKEWLIRPGVRADLWNDDTATKAAIDPRLTMRYQIGTRDLVDVAPTSDDSKIWLKGSLGIYHQPPRFVLPLPGFDLMPLKFGLLRSYQSSVGVEVPLAKRFQFTGEGYFNYMDPTIFDLSVNEASVVNQASPTLLPTQVVNSDDNGGEFIDRLTKPQLGRSYGLEALLRRQAKDGIFGWISYTLSRSERFRDGAWAPYDFDRTHLVNVVAGLPLRRNWDIGMRLQYQSGKPTTITSGFNAGRTAGYVRFDVRIDKHVVYKNWLMDFYVDVTNIAVLPEEVSAGSVLRYVLPTLGFRGRF
jgi:hypothetical protein